MSMADDNTRRSYRSNEPFRQAAEPPRPSEQASDPLAELARLIGRNDPFAELGRSQPRHASQQAARAAAAPSDDWHHASAREPHFGHDEYASHDAQDSYQDSYHEPHQGSRRESFQDPRHASSREADHGQHYDPRYDSHQDYAQPYGAEGRRQDAYEDDRYHQDAYQDGGHGYHDGRGYDELHAEGDDHQHGQHYADGHQGAQHDGDEAEYYYEDDAPLAPHEDEMYDDAPRARRRGGLVTALALVGCAMIGTAGAYAYRSYTGHPGSLQSPPVITADSSTPNKIVPASAADSQSNKAIQDRLATASREQIVPKQEEPVALKELGTSPPPRVVLPAPVPPVQSGLAGVSTEPKKVKPIAIRPDGTDPSGRPVGTVPPPATRSVAPAPAPKAGTAQPKSGGPISLDPQASEPAPAPTRTATLPPPARTAPEPASGSGGFVVQLSSQKSESEAQASFRSLQAKFPNELGNRQPIIRRADLGGSKGVVYRAMVGPFASSQEASQFCTTYKAAGGQCFLPKE
ncbi:MAG TPA: SPOR domain-containing protein [Xanthobacteraceae bacterium]|nr:SPOR domain-containing protein [Xanthobacteraceae bacterium]